MLSGTPCRLVATPDQLEERRLLTGSVLAAGRLPERLFVLTDCSSQS